MDDSDRTCGRCGDPLVVDDRGNAVCPRCRAGRAADLPPGGLVQLVEWTDERLVLVVPTSSRGRHLPAGPIATLVFAIGLALVGTLTTRIDWLTYTVFGTLLGTIGLLAAIHCWRASAAAYVLLERDRFAVRRRAFGIGWTTTIALDADSRADVSVTYDEETEAETRTLRVHGVGRSVEVPLHLTAGERTWFKRAFAQFIDEAWPAARKRRMFPGRRRRRRRRTRS